jgi:enolase-phosphatase E1
VIEAIVTDIEGTTSSISFVKDELFPYAAKHLPSYVREHQQEPDVRQLLEAAAALADIEFDVDQLIEQLLNWIASDTKAAPLKALQGMIWQRGYETGAYTAHVYADAKEGLGQWHDDGIKLYVYSSGSVRAQQLFFRYSTFGDLRPLFSGYFDTTIGGKSEARSYAAIANAIGANSERILFLSDVEAELDAASAAGFQSCWVIRPDDISINPKQIRSAHSIATSFDKVNVPRSKELV